MFLTYLPTLTLVPCPNNSAKQADSYLANNKWARTHKLCDIISRVQDRLDWPYYWHRSSISCPFGCSAHAAEGTQLQVSKQSRKKILFHPASALTTCPCIPADLRNSVHISKAPGVNPSSLHTPIRFQKGRQQRGTIRLSEGQSNQNYTC